MLKFLKRLSLLFLIFPLISFPVIAAEATESAENIAAGEIVRLDSNEVVTNDYFAGADEIELMGKVEGDAALAGSIIDVSGTIEGDLLVAAGTIIISGDIKEDARIAGGKVHISGSFGKNLWVAGGQVTISEDAQIGGSLIVMGGLVTVRGSNGKDVRMYGADLFYGGQTDANAYLEGDLLEVTEDVVIAGNLDYVYGTDAKIAMDASIAGETFSQTLEEKYPDGSNYISSQEWFFNDGTLNAAMLIVKFINYVSVLIVGLLIILLFPKISPKIVEVLDKNPGNSFLIGVLGFPVLGTTLIFLTLTLVGIPLMLLLLGSSILFVFVSKIFIAIWLGKKLLEFLNRETLHDMWLLLIGMFIYELLTMIPGIGWIISFGATALGMGAILIALNDQRMASK